MQATKYLTILILFMGLSYQPLFAQESILKEHVEHKRDKKYCFYPSTLRMVNLKQNQDYNALVNGVDKLLIYTLDSATRADKSYRLLTDSYLAEGFDEYATIFGGSMNLSILGKEGKTQQYVGYFDQDGEVVVAFYLKGDIPWQKIPTLLQNMNDMDMLDLFDFKDLSF
ncbi:DUF4252 domain-containing protein [Marinoscillum pacificum]|uniref:DUF4252 domain-containing protein n=1 Tax=Marinoscillum pacificum TaxID=392723 RepID=UPI0021574868|nr:DUF4252 domain-containing protein [Marinoscillum pacificum]